MTFATALLRHAVDTESTIEVDRQNDVSEEDFNFHSETRSSNVSLESSDHDDGKQFYSDFCCWKLIGIFLDHVDGSYRWSHDSVILLLSIYEEKQHSLIKGKVRQNVFWNRIANLMNEKDYAVNGPQCRTKLATLRRQYKKVKDHNKCSGNDRKDWPYLDVSNKCFLFFCT